MNAQGYHSSTEKQEIGMRRIDLLLDAWPHLAVKPQEILYQYYYWREAPYQAGELGLPSFLSDVETELKTKARQLGWIDWDKRREG